MRYVNFGSNILVIFTVTACSSMQPTPIMPTYPAHVGRGGVSARVDNMCRNEAYQAAEQVKQSNVNKEIAFTAIGTVAGAVVGQALTPHHPGGPGPVGPGGPRGPGPGPHPGGGPNLAGAGALTGAAAGAALSQGAVQNPQQVYDITYNNCIEANRYHRHYRY